MAFVIDSPASTLGRPINKRGAVIQQPLEERQLPPCPFHDHFKSLESLSDLCFSIKFARGPSTSGAGEGDLLCLWEGGKDGVEGATVVTMQPLGVIAGSATAPSFLIDVHLLLCFSPLLFALVGFSDACYCWAERGSKRNCSGQARGEAGRCLAVLSRQQHFCISDSEMGLI